MSDFVSTNLPVVVAGAVILIALLWWLLLANRKTRVAVDRRDTLDDGAARAERNQALIDAPPAATRIESVPVPPAVPEAIGGAGVAVAAAVEAAAVEAAQLSRDDLTQIKGLGPKLATTLHELGVSSFAQIADWSDADIDRVDAQLGRFEGRIRRDNWVEQAKLLAAGDTAGFSARFGAQ